MTVKKYLEPLYNSFGMGPQSSVCINSITPIDLDSTGFDTLCLDFDQAHGLQVKVAGQSGIKYPSMLILPIQVCFDWMILDVMPKIIIYISGK
jgi:hypothetical protein